MPSPTAAAASLPERLADAEGELPEEIAATIGKTTRIAAAFAQAHWSDRAPIGSAYDATLKDLTATILARLTAAESARDAAVAELDDLVRILANRRAERDAAIARAERLKDALREAAEWHDSKADNLRGRPQSIDTRWRTAKHVEELERIKAALAHPAPAEET